VAKQKKKRVLQDHKQIGKRFIPPFLQQLNLKELSYVKLLFPHLVWMGLLNDRFGYKMGVNLSIELAKLSHSVFGSKKHVNFALCGSYSVLSPELKSKIVRACEQNGWLKDVQRALAPITHHYDEFPMAFLGIGDLSANPGILLQELKQTVAKCMNKYETPGLVLQTNLIVAQTATGGLFFSEDIKLPDFDSIVSDPDSEAAKRAAAFVRAGALAMCMPDDLPLYEKWSKSFWNQGYRVDPCSFLEDHDD
jgi:hypothetical protein